MSGQQPQDGGWTFGIKRGFYSGRTLQVATRPHPEVHDHAQVLVARTLGELHAALQVHDELDRLRETYGDQWAIGADEVMPTWRIRWVWAAPRASGQPGLRPVPTPAELEAVLVAETEWTGART